MIADELVHHMRSARFIQQVVDHFYIRVIGRFRLPNIHTRKPGAQRKCNIIARLASIICVVIPNYTPISAERQAFELTAFFL